MKSYLLNFVKKLTKHKTSVRIIEKKNNNHIMTLFPSAQPHFSTSQPWLTLKSAPH